MLHRLDSQQIATISTWVYWPDPAASVRKAARGPGEDGSFPSSPPGKGKVSGEMSTQHMQGRASRCDMSASTTLSERAWGLV